MKSILIISLILISFFSFSQIDYQVRIDELYSAADDSDGSGNEDPVWKVRMQDNDGGTLQNSGCISVTKSYNSWWSGNPVTGVTIPYSWFTRTGTNATTFSTWMEAWEDDGCSSTCSYNTSCLFNDDDAKAPVGSSDGTYGTTQTVNIFNNGPCSWSQYTLTIIGDNNNGSPSDYRAHVSVYWEVSGGIDPGGISGDQTICSGQDPTIIGSTSAGSVGNANYGSYFSYQWQQDVGCTGVWTDIVGATLSNFDPPVLSQSTCYRRVTKSAACGDVMSNTVTITVNSVSVIPSTITSNPTALCGAGTVDITVGGGTLGTGAQYELYSGSCGGTLIGTSATPNFSSIAVAATTDFYARISGTCNTTSCVTVNVPVSTPSTDPTGASASSTTICDGDPVTLSVVGGSLGTSATWEWYSGTCGTGVNVGSGASISVSPSTNTTYYVRAEGGCGSTACASVSITVNQVSVAATSASASPSSYCSGGSSVLSVVGGTLGTGADWYWYEGGCGLGSPVGTGASVTVSPTVTTDYYVRAEGTCGNTTCILVTVTVNQSGSDPTGIAATNTNVCPGQTTVLSVTGGSLGTGATWEWYSGSCGGTSVGSGNTISVAPTATTTYFVRAEGTCGSSNCASVLISVGVGANDPTAATVINDNICPGDTSQVYVTGGVLPAGYEWVWYTGACGAIPVGVGDTIAVTPTATTTYYVRATGTCGNTNCTSATVTVQNGSVAATGIIADDNNICPGSTVNLSVDGGSLVSGAQWTWYENSCGGTAIGTGSSIAVSPTTSSAYYVRAEGGTCGNTECVNNLVNVLDAYAYMVAFDDQCGVGAPIELNNGIPAGGTYSGTGVSGGVFYPDSVGVGTYTITYDYVFDNGCTSNASADITIGSSNITVSAVVEVEECSNGGVTLVAAATGGAGGYDYLWSDGSQENPHTYVEPGTYSVTVTDADNCSGTASGVEVSESLACLEMANTFTPNADGTNDTWNLDFTAYTSASLEVYSKWGVLVYSTNSLTINWDGNDMSGNALPAGTYYYIIDLDQGSITQNGPISIVR